MDHANDAIDEQNQEAWSLILSTPEKALSLAEASLARAEEMGYARGMAESRLNVGWCEYYLTRVGAAIESFQKALDSFTQAGDELGVIKSLNALGEAYKGMGRYERAMDYFTRSLTESRKVGNRLREAVTLDGIGEVCLELDELKEALDYFLRAYETLPDDGESELISTVLLDIGAAYFKMDNWQLAGEFAEKALGSAILDGNFYAECQCLHLLGLIAQASDDLDLAESMYMKALGICEMLKNERERASLLLDLGSKMVESDELRRGLECFASALAIAEAIGAKRLANTAFERLSGAYEILGDYKLSLDFYKRFSRFEHEALSEDASRKIKNITVQYEIEKSSQEAEIYRLKNIELKGKTEELEAANRQILAIADTGRVLTASLDLDTIINTLYDMLSLYLRFDSFGLALYEGVAGTLDYIAYFEDGRRVQRVSLEPAPRDGIAARCCAEKIPFFISDTREEGLPELATIGPAESRGSSLMVLPLVIDDRSLGLLDLRSLTAGAWDTRDFAFVEAVAPYVAIAVENSLIHDRLESLNRAIRGEKEELEKEALTIAHIANHDSLTGLPNRRLLFELMQKTFEMAKREGTKVGVLYIDLDDFKPINDRLGHSAGDRALVSVAERLRSILRASDTVARVGGDEFVAVVSSASDKAGIALAAGKILEECLEPFAIEGATCKLGLSIGIAVFPDDGEDLGCIIGAADAAMYRVKRKRKGGYAFACEGKAVLAQQDSGSVS